MQRAPARLLIVFCLAAAACSPASHTAAVVEGETTSPADAALEGGAAPPASKINRKFLAPDLDVEQWVRIFEGESREIFVARAAIVASLSLRPGEAVADIGAGTGLFLAPLAAQVGPAGRVYAVEISPRFLEHLRQRARREALSQVRVVEGTATSVQLPAASIDLAFVCDTYHHFEQPQTSLASLYAAIKPGGRLVIVDFERNPGETKSWILEHVRAGKQTFISEIETAGFGFEEEIAIEGLSENYVLRFRRP